MKVEGSRWRIAWPLLVAVVANLVLTLWLYSAARSDEQERLTIEVERRAADFASAIQSGLDRQLDTLGALGGLHDVNPDLSRADFRRFVNAGDLLEADVQALEWIPRVRASVRSAYEARARRTLADFQIRERRADGALVAAGEREEYFPVYFVEPLVGNEAAVGFDLASDATRRAALERSRDSGEAVATGRITLIQENGHQAGFLVFAPVYDLANPQGALVAERRTALRGFVLGVFRVGDMAHAVLGAANGLHTEIWDETGPEGAARLFPGGETADVGFAMTTVQLEVPGRTWTARFRPTAALIGEFGAVRSRATLAGGVAYTVLLMLFLAVYFYRAIDRAREAVRLTRDVEAERRRRVEMDRIARNLKRSNEELERFASIASHDLQEPLRKVSSFCELLDKQYGESLDDQGRTYLRFAVDGAKRMRQLIQDLLSYSRVEQSGGAVLCCDMNEALAEALVSLTAPIEECAAEVSHASLPELAITPLHGKQLFQNLIGNALKYRSHAPPKIHVSVVSTEHDWEIAVSDNGIGIDPRFHDRVFGVFKRLHTADEYPGTGIGLAICSRIVEGRGGRLWVESEGVEGRGSTFRFALPKSVEGERKDDAES